MKYRITILILSLFFVNTAFAQTYTGTVPNDLSVTTPTEGSTKFREINNAIREIKTVDKNLYTILAVGTTTTLTGTSTFIIGSSTTALTLNFPTASTIATSTCTKEYVILNRNTGTVTLNIAVEGISGSPTVSQNNNIVVYTDGTTWFEQRVQNAYNAINFGSIGTSSFARSGANSDITAITGLTTYLAIGQGGSGTNTAAGAASAFGVGTEDTPTLTGVVTTGSSTITTLALSNGTVSGTLGIGASGSVSGLEDADIPNDATLTNITQVTNRSLSNMQDTIGFATQTSGFLSIATQTSGLLSMATQTTGLVSIATQTAGLLSFATQTVGQLSLGTQTNGLLSFATQTVGLVSLGTQTNGLLSLATQTAGNYLQSWTTGSQTTAATGTVRFISTGDITTTSTYDNNGNGTITTALAAGVSAKPDAKVNGVVQVTNPTAYDFPGGFVSIAGSGTDAAITFKNPSLATQTSGLLSLATQTTGLVSFATQTTGLVSFATQTTGLVSFATQTTGLVSFGTQTNGLVSIATQTTGLLSLGSQTTGELSWDSIDDTIISVSATTTTTLSGTTTTGRIFNTQSTTASASGSTTAFDDSSSTNHTLTPGGSAIMSTAQKKFGLSSGLFGSGSVGYVTIPAHANWNFGQNDFTIEIQRKSTDTASMGAFSWGPTPNDGTLYEAGSATQLYLISTGTDSATIASADTYGTRSTTLWNHAAISRQGNNLRGFTDGVQGATWTVTGKTFDYSGNTLTIGVFPNLSTNPFNGHLDELRISNVARYTGNYATPTSAFENDANTLLLVNFDRADTAYFTNRLAYVPPGTTTPSLSVMSRGTNTTDNTYLLADVTTSIFGLGTTTDVTGTSNAYAGWFNGAVRGTAFNVASSEFNNAGEKVKENIKDIKIKPDWLDAEAEAKEKYIKTNKAAWDATNKATYTYSVTETGTGTVTYVDNTTMEKAYITAIELQWASDLNQGTLIENVQKEHERNFWQEFDSVHPKEWNPTENLSLTRRGFVVEEVPDRIKGDDKRTIDPMAVLAIQQKVLQDMKAKFESAGEEIGSLTVALENQKVFYNEEVDNLYNWVNALAVALLALGGISGWTTLRNKRKGT